MFIDAAAKDAPRSGGAEPTQSHLQRWKHCTPLERESWDLYLGSINIRLLRS
jgi:hypothetical protein